MESNVDGKARRLGEIKLMESGLDAIDAEKLGIQFLEAEESAALSPVFKSLCALKLNYLSPTGEPLVDWPKSDPFYRLRYLGAAPIINPILNGKSKSVRYVQPPNTAPVAYYPQNFSGWEELCKDADKPLIITEGELKASKSCKEGFPTLGIGGVYSWKSNTLGLEWLPSLDLIEWRKRNVYLCFDSDYRTNPMVCSALRDFAEAMHYRGSFVRLVSLPQLPGLEKVGLDDFLVHGGPSSGDMFRELLKEAEPLGLSAPLWHINTKYVYVRDPGFIVRRMNLKQRVSPSAFKEHTEAASLYQERRVSPKGAISFKPVSAAAAWLKWPLRVEAERLTYAPGEDLFFGDEPLLNTWPGWGVVPKEGCVEPFLQLIDHLFTGAEEESKQWFLQWCAYPLQNPGVKMFSSAVIHGVRQGTGKTLVGDTLGEIYGENSSSISQDDLEREFNGWADSKQFVRGDDVTGSKNRKYADYLKKIITQKKMRINIKHVAEFDIPDCVNYFFTSQHGDSFFLEDDDRRFFIHEVVVGSLGDDFYGDYEKWLRRDGGAAAIFHYLLKLDITNFNPSSRALKTAAKLRMIVAGRSDLACWVRQLLESPNQFLCIGTFKLEKDLFTSKELLFLYDPDKRTPITANGLARELGRAGVRQACDGKPVKTSDGVQGRYYPIRNSKEWEDAKPKIIVEHLENFIREGGQSIPKF